MKYFSNIATAEDLKKQFHFYCNTLHPDHGGKQSEFVEMMSEYTLLLKDLKNIAGNTRKIIDEWAEITNKAKHTTTDAEIKIGDFVSYFEGLEKSNDIFDAVESYVKYCNGKAAQYGKVEAIVFMTDEEADNFNWSYEKPSGAGNGGTFGPVMDNQKDDTDKFFINNPKHEHFYTLLTMIKTPSRYFFIDCEGYEYARIIGLPECFTSFKEYTKVQNEIKAEEEQKKREEEGRKAAENEIINKWGSILEEIPQDDQKRAKTIFKKNIKAIFLHYFPSVKVSIVDQSKRWCEHSKICWIDGPTVEEVENIAEFYMFISWHYECDTYADYGYRSLNTELSKFRYKFGSWSNDEIEFQRTLSENEKAKAEAKAIEFFPQLAREEAKSTKCGEGVEISMQEAEKAAEFFGLHVDDLNWSTCTDEETKKYYEQKEKQDKFTRFVCSNNYYNNKLNIYNVLDVFAKFWKVEQQTKEAKNETGAEEKTPQGEAPAEGLQLVNIARGVAVVGDPHTTFKNRKEIKRHGAIWNKSAQQWQGTTAEAVEQLRKWFGISEEVEKDEQKTAEDFENLIKEVAEDTEWNRHDEAAMAIAKYYGYSDRYADFEHYAKLQSKDYWQVAARDVALLNMLLDIAYNKSVEESKKLNSIL